jgi:hypothetical protein
VKSALHLLIALASMAALLTIFFFWMVIPVAGILLYVLVRYGFRRRRPAVSIGAVRLANESDARAADIRRSA